MSRKLILILIVLLAFIGFWLVPFYLFVKNDLRISLAKTLFSLDGPKQIDNQTNILILGIPGQKHDGPTLSDSITVIHFDSLHNKLISIGIPRDLWSNTLQDKINSAYAYGEAKVSAGGIKLAKAEVGAIIGEPVEYAVVINFQHFEQLIDSLGGVNINVQHSFVDHKFPIDGKENDLCGGDPEFKCRYQTVPFTKGMTHMDGETALKFVRSRNAEGEEGNDFARSQRQQLILSAVKSKTIAIMLSFNLAKTKGLYYNFDKLVQRDLTNQQVAVFLKDILLNKSLTQNSFSLPQQLFTVPDPLVYYGKYVLIPKDNNYDTVHKYVDCLFSISDSQKCLPKS